MADYHISLENGYRIDRLSAHEIVIYGDEPIQSDDDTREDYLYVPEKVTDVWWNDHYIIAKQLELITTENGYQEPPKKNGDAIFTYWIIDTKNHQVLSLVKEDELTDEINRLGITEEIQLTPVEKLK